MKPGGQRTKGHSFERWWARFFRETFAEYAAEAKRGWQARGGGKEEPDVQTYIDGERLPVHWELCHGKAPSVWAKMAQAEEDRDDADVPIVIVKRDRGTPMVFLSVESFIPFLEAWIVQNFAGE